MIPKREHDEMSQALHVVCPHCQGVNRVAENRMADRPVCGKCRTPLFDGHPVELTSTEFDVHLGRNDIPLLVDFWAPWCAPCRTMAPAYHEAARILEPRVRVAKVNTEAEQALATRFNIRSIPTLALFRNGREIARQAGAIPAQDIVRWAVSLFKK
jgi:thioredoxin 2